jgi:hypothetical protein
MLSAFDCSCGSTSPTVRSTSTPLIMRKHLRVVGRGVRVSRTSLEGAISTSYVVINLSSLARHVLSQSKEGHKDTADTWSGIKGHCGDKQQPTLSEKLILGFNTTNTMLRLLSVSASDASVFQKVVVLQGWRSDCVANDETEKRHEQERNVSKKDIDGTYLCSSTSCSTLPICEAMFWSVSLKLEYCICSSDTLSAFFDHGCFD